MSEVSTSRRNVMRALAFVPAVIAAPAAISAAVAARPSSAAWDAAMARYLTAKAKNDAFEGRAKPIWNQVDAARPSYTITHVAKDGSSATFRVGPDDFANYETKPGEIDGSSFIQPQVKALKAQHLEFERVKREVGYNEISRLSDRYCDEMNDAEYALLNMQAPHLRAVEWKLTCLAEIAKDSQIDPEDLNKILADLRLIYSEA